MEELFDELGIPKSELYSLFHNYCLMKAESLNEEHLVRLAEDRMGVFRAEDQLSLEKLLEEQLAAAVEGIVINVTTEMVNAKTDEMKKR